MACRMGLRLINNVNKSLTYLEILYLFMWVLNGVYTAKRLFNGDIYGFDGHAPKTCIYHMPATYNDRKRVAAACWQVPEVVACA